MATKVKRPSTRNVKKSKAAILKSRVTYRAPVFYVTSEIVREPSGVTARRDIVRHPGSVVVLAVESSGRDARVLLAKQFRYAARKQMLELPAGRIDAGETALEAGKRELSEETGYRARKWSKAMFFYVSPGFLDETMTIFLAEELEPGKATPEEDEVIRARLVPLPKAVDMVMKGRIQDAKTIAGVLWYARRITNS
ncbi:MAG: NUDIX hydrolase [Terriglobia bacterium]|jgi:ADP-ribose pyrophosphatase|nr:NUDIX hydrolase [Terriglobia bacterium]